MYMLSILSVSLLQHFNNPVYIDLNNLNNAILFLYFSVTDCPATTRFRCFMTGVCLPNTVVCDGHDDCGDGSDEKDCGMYFVLLR